jgi:peptidoglycan/xylan/chitin deacetylase (PgdA/CDA1 family)
MRPDARSLALAATRLPVVRRSIERLAARDRGREDLLAILTYHRVDEPSDDLQPGIISATPSAFARQIAWLARRYRVVTLADLLARREGGAALPPRSVLITFDDAYRDFATHAWPVLQANGVTATLFVPTAFPGDPGRSFWWDRLHRAVMRAHVDGTVTTPLGPVVLGDAAARRKASRRLRGAVKGMEHDAAMAAVDGTVTALGGDGPEGTSGSAPGPVLSWDELRDLRAAGVELGVHSRTHPLLDRLARDELDAEIAGARSDLEAALGGTFSAIAYPNGNHSPAVRAAAADAGMRVGFTTRRGTNDLRRPDWLALRRINVGQATDITILAAQLQRWVRRWR